MAHIREKPVLSLIEHLDLVVLPFSCNDLLVKPVFGIKHHDTHKELEYCKDDKVIESRALICCPKNNTLVEEVGHRGIGYDCQNNVLQRLHVDTQRNQQRCGHKKCRIYSAPPHISAICQGQHKDKHHQRQKDIYNIDYAVSSIVISQGISGGQCVRQPDHEQNGIHYPVKEDLVIEDIGYKECQDKQNDTDDYAEHDHKERRLNRALID